MVNARLKVFQFLAPCKKFWAKNRKWIFVSILFSLVAISIFLRLYHVTNYLPLHPDEPRMNLPGVVWEDRHVWLNFWNAESRIGTDPILLWTSVFLYEVLDLEPSAFLVRTPALFFNCLLILLAFWQLPKLFRKDIGLLMALLIAVHPLHMKLSRYGYDPSHTPFTSFIVLLLALRGQWILASAAFYVSIMTHPANIFLGPIFLAVFFFRDEARPLAWRNTAWWKKLFLCISLLCSAAIAWEIVERWLSFYPWQVDNSSSGFSQQLQNLERLVPFFWHVMSVLSGASASLELQSWLRMEAMWPAAKMAFPAALIIGTTLAAHIVLVRKRLVVPLSILVALFAFYLLTSDRPHIPTYERFLVWAVIPVILWCVWVWWKVADKVRFYYLPHILTIIIAGCMVFAFHDQYFLRLRNHPDLYDPPAHLELTTLSLIQGARDRNRIPVLVTNYKKMHWGTCYFIHRSEYADYWTHLGADPKHLPTRCMMPKNFSPITHQVFVVIRTDDAGYKKYVQQPDSYRLIWEGGSVNRIAIFEYRGDYSPYRQSNNQWVF